MNCVVSVAVFLAVTVSLASSDPALQRNAGRYHCAGYCKGSSKFKYVPGTTYLYDYTANTLTSVRGATKENSQLHLTAVASFHVVSQCDFILQLENVQLKDSDLTNSDSQSSVERSTYFTDALQKNSLHFSFQDGTVDELCPSDDAVWVLNIKRGILSAFQNTMHDLSSVREKHHETDITGTCETNYDVILEEDESNNPLLVIGKMKNLAACSHRMDHFLSLQSTPYMSSAAQSLPLIKSQQRGKQIIRDNILQKSVNNEIHTFRPFSKHESGAVTMVNQILTYKTSHNEGAPSTAGEAPKRRTTLLYEHIDTINDEMNQEYNAIELLETLVKKTHNGVEADVPSMFSQLVKALTSMNHMELVKVFNHATDKQMRKFLLDAMPLVRTTDGVTIMLELFKTGEISSVQMDSWLTSLAFQKKPTLTMISSVSSLLDETPSVKALLGISALIHSYCQQNRNCFETNEVREVMGKIEALLGSSCKPSNQAEEQIIILALKAIGNAGIFTGSSDTLKKCIQMNNPIEIRLAAISAYRRLPCEENNRSHLLDLYTNKRQDTELRIAAYLAVMQCPSSQTIRHIKDTLYSEEVNQVASFVWTHMTNLQETSSHWKKNVKELVSSDFLRNKFKTDVRKFSRNYEGSFFSESLNAGAAAESNIVFTPQSYLPRSASLNLTLDLFGESINILEIGARAEGFEHIVENMFGPEGYFSDNAVNKMLKKFKDNSESDNVENSINQLADKFNAKANLEKEPSASLYTRVFGNELQYSELHGQMEMMNLISKATSFDHLKKITQGNGIDFTRSLVLIDGSYTIPTCIGLPMNLALNGSTTVGLKLHGHANIRDLFTLNSIDIEGSLTPSAAVEFTGTMAVDANIIKAGVKLVSTMHTNTYINGKMKIQGGNLVDLQLNVPRDKIELLKVESQLYVLHRNQLVQSKGIHNDMENYQMCSTDFFNSLTGMKSCMELTYVNSSLHPTAPYFPLTGPFKFHLGVTKVDTFDSYKLIFKHQNELSTSYTGTSMIFHFDTPGSRVDRKLSAQYTLDWTNSAAKASIITPYIKITASGKVENSDTLNSLDAVLVLNDKELFTTRLGLKRSQNGHTGRYEPFFALSYRKNLIADVTGKVNYIEGFKYSADLMIKGFSKDPIEFSGDLNMNDDKYDLMGNIKSSHLSSTFHGSLRLTENYLTTKATVQYKIKDAKSHTLDFSAKLQSSSKGTLTKESALVTLQMSHLPGYNVEASWDMQHSDYYFESIGKLAVGDIVWQTQHLLRFQSTAENIDIAGLCTLTCPKLDVDYGVDVKYQVTNATISSHFITTITPRYKLQGHLDYLHKLENEMHHHHLHLTLNSPWYKTGINGLLTETAPSRHEIQLSTWWTAQRDIRRVNISGIYLDGSNKVKTEHQLDLTLAGHLNGKLSTGLTSSSNTKNQWIQLDIYNKTYLANMTYIKDIFHFMEATVKLADSTYGGSLVLLSTAIEKGFAIDLKLRRRLTMATKITCNGEKHGLQFELFWDKDANPNKKISLVAQAMGNKKEVLLEIPGRYLKGEVVTVASGVTGFLEWAEDRKISAQLEWNLDEGRADITAKLSTPFPKMESLNLFATYTLLENEGIFFVDMSWQKEKLNLTMNVKRNNTSPNFLGLKLSAHVASTVPAIADIFFDLDHSSLTNQQLSIKTVALLNYNKKQSTLEANWNSDKSSLFGNLMLNSPIQCMKFMKHTIKFTDSPIETSGSFEMNWTHENKIIAEFVIKKVDGAIGSFRIVTPFIGYEITSAEYNFTKIQHSDGTMHIRMQADAVFKEYLAMFHISGSKSNSTLYGTLQFKTPFTEEFKVAVHHKMEKGKFNETFLISLADENLFLLFLDGKVQSFSNIQLSAGIQMPNQNVTVTLGNILLSQSLHFNCGGKWNVNNISITAVGKYENAEDILSIHFDMAAAGSILPQHVRLSLDHTRSGGTFQTSIHLPGEIVLTNMFIINNSLNWENKLNFKTPKKVGSIENKQSFKDDFALKHEVIAKLNGQQASGIITFEKDSQSVIIRKAKAVLITPWTDPVTILYELPMNDLNIKPSLVLQFKRTKEIRIDIELMCQLLHSRLHMQITSPFHKPIVVSASYNLEKPKLMGQILMQWEGKKVSMESNIQFEFDMKKTSGDFFIRHSDVDTDIASGSFGYSVINPEITAHAFGMYKEQRISFGLSLLLERKVYKGSLTLQTPFKNWENLSLSGQVNMAKSTKLAVMTLTRNREDITVSGLFSSDIHSSKFSVALTSHIPGFHSVSFYGSYDVPNSNDHSIELTYDNNGKKIEFLTKLQFDEKSFLNSIMAESTLKTPFKGYESLLAHYSYNVRGNEKRLDLRLIKNSWKFSVESECSVNPEEGIGQLKVELPFADLKEMSFSLRYGLRPSTQEKTVSILMSRNQLMVEMAGTLLISDDGSLTADVEIKSPIRGYRKVKCSVALSASQGQRIIVTLMFSKDQDDFMISGRVTMNSEATLVITTPLKGFEKIEAKIGYISYDEDRVNSNIRRRVYGILDMPIGGSEISMDLDLKKTNSFFTVTIVSPLLVVPHIEIKGEYDFRILPASVAFSVNNGAIRFTSVQILLERNRLVGEIITPIEGYKNISLSGSFRIQEDRKTTNLKVQFDEHSYQLSSSIALGVLTSELQAELTTSQSGIEKISLHGLYDFLQNEKTAEISLTLDPNHVYEILISGTTSDSKSGQAKVQIYTPISKLESILLVAKYDFTHNYYANLLVQKNGVKNSFGGQVTFTDDGTVIKIETPFDHAKDISMYGTYHTANDEYFANLTVVKNGYLTILNTSFKLESNVATIKFSTPFELIHDLIITTNFSDLSTIGKDSTFSISVLRNSHYILKASSHVAIDWTKEIDAQFVMDVPFITNGSEHLGLSLSFSSAFPLSHIQLTAIRNQVRVLDIVSDLNIKSYNFIYNFQLTTFFRQQEKVLFSIDFSTIEKYIKFNVDSTTADKLNQYVGDFRFNKDTGTLTAVFMTPVIGYEKFSFHLKYGYDFIDSELITPFKGYENQTLAAHFEVKHGKTSARFFGSRNNDVIGFRTNLEYLNGGNELNLYIITPFTLLKKFDIHTRYMKTEDTKMVELSFAINNNHFDLGGESMFKENVLEAKLDISSSLQVIKSIKVNVFYNLIDFLTFGGKLDISNMSANFENNIDLNFMQGKLLGSMTRHGHRMEYSVVWNVKNNQVMKTAKIAMNLGYDLNFDVFAVLNVSDLKIVGVEVSFMESSPNYPSQQITLLYKLEWNFKNILSFDGGVNVELYNKTFFKTNVNVSLDNDNEGKSLNIEYFSMPLPYFIVILPSTNLKILIAYQMLNNSNIEFFSTVKMGEIHGSIHSIPKRTKISTGYGEFHFSLSCDLTTENKTFDVEYQVGQQIYRFNTNLTIPKTELPTVSFTLKSPIKHYSLLHISNQYIMNGTHKGFKIFLQKEEKHGEISMLLWTSRNNVGIISSMSLPNKYSKIWHGVANLDMSSGITVIVNCSWNPTKHLVFHFEYVPGTLKATILSPFTGLEQLHAELNMNTARSLNTARSVNISLSFKWGEKILHLTSFVNLNSKSKSEVSVLFISPWMDTVALAGEFDHSKSPLVTMILQIGNQFTRLDGHINYIIKDSKFEVDFISEVNGKKLSAKVGYDLEHSSNKAYFEGKFAKLNVLVNGILSTEGMTGNLHVRTPFSCIKGVTAEGKLLFGQSASFKLRWNDELYTLSGEYQHQHGQVGGQFTLLSPYGKLEDMKFDIKYNSKFAHLKVGNSSEVLYLDCSYHFGTHLYSHEITLKVPSISLLKHMIFATSLDTEKLEASAVVQWSENKMVNISANLLSGSHYIKVETPFEGFKKIIANSIIKNEHSQVAFMGKLEWGTNGNLIEVNHIVGKGILQHVMVINMPSYAKLNFNLNLQFDDPSNISARLLIGHLDSENSFVKVYGMLNLKDMLGKFSYSDPFFRTVELEGQVTCKTWRKMKVNFQLKFVDEILTAESSYILSNNEVMVRWHAQTSNWQTTTVLGGSYEYDKSEMRTRLYFNEDIFSISYKVNHESLTGNLKFNSSALLKIEDFNLDIEGSYWPVFHGLVSYKCDTSSGGVGISVSNIEETVVVQGFANVKPLFGPTNHAVKFTYNMMKPRSFVDLKYEGKSVHEINISYVADDNIFKVLTDVNSNLLGKQKILILFKKNWEVMHLEIPNMFSFSMKVLHNEGSLTVKAAGSEHEVLYRFTIDNSFLGNITLVSPLISNSKVNLSAIAKSDNDSVFVLLECVSGTKLHRAVFEINNSKEKKTLKVEIISLLKTILNLNAYVILNRNSIQAETSLDILGTISNAVLQHKRVLPLDSELNIMSPYLPKKIIRIIVNTENNSLILYGGHGDMSFGQYIILEGSLNHNEGTMHLNFKAPRLSLIQYVGITGIFKLNDEGMYSLGFTSQFSSEMVRFAELTTKCYLSSAGIDAVINFVPPWQKNENYGIMLLIPFVLSNDMRPRITLNLGRNNIYSLHGTFVNLKDVQQIGFGTQYRLRKLGGSLKIENTSVPGIQAELDIPLGENIGHYSIDIKAQEGKNLLGIENVLNYTHIGVEWDNNRIELRYSLSYNNADVESSLDIDQNLQCTFVLQLSTPFRGYEQNGLKMYVKLSSSHNLVTMSLNYPENSKPFGFELSYHLKDYSDVNLVSQLHIPFISSLEDVALVFSSKLEEEYGRFRSVLAGHWNEDELAISLEGNVAEKMVLKGSVILELIGQRYMLEANYESSSRDIVGPFVIRAQLTSPFSALKSAEVFVEIDLMKSALVSITHNSEELLGFRIYSDEVTLFAAEVTNPWRSVYFVFGYDMSKDILIQAELSWVINRLNKSQFGVIFALSYGPNERQDMSATLKLPTRVLMLNLTREFSPANIEYAVSVSWKKGQVIGFKTITNINASSDVIAITTMSRIDLPYRSFELGSHASARLDIGSVKYADIGTEFLWNALEDRRKKIGIECRHYSPVIEIVFQHAALENDLIIRVEKNGSLSYNYLPFTMKVEVAYSPLKEELITFQVHIQQPINTAMGLDVGLSLLHIPTSLDFKIQADVSQTSGVNSGRLSTEYLNSYTGQKHRLEFMGKMDFVHSEIKIALKTAENQLEVHGRVQSRRNGYYSVLFDLLMNQKEPLNLEVSLNTLEPRAELEAHIGDSRSYAIYASIPHCREVTFGIKHVLYGSEFEDVAIILQLNTSQQLWSRVKWQPRALTELKTGFLQEYSDISHVIQSIGSGFSEVWLKDFAYKSNIIYPKLMNVVSDIVSTSVIEVGNIYKDVLTMGEDMTAMYRRNDFYLRDIQPYASKLISYIKEKASGICRLLLDAVECIYLAAKDFILLIVNALQIDPSLLLSVFNDVKVATGKAVAFVVNFVEEIKRLHSSTKDYLKGKIEAARTELAHAEENMKHMLTNVENYFAELLIRYIDMLEPYLTNIENTMELLSRRVVDFEDKISEYVLDMVDTVLGAEEIQELVAIYNKYSSWLEELHLQDYIDQITKLFASIGKLIMQDVRRICFDYLEYVNYLTDAVNNIYKNINTMPVIAYSKHAVNIVYEKAKWVWMHYELSDILKEQVHSWIENLDKLLLRLLSAIDMDARSPTKTLTPSITLRPDIGLIEYSQKLPIDWHGFNELPKFEQLQLYEQAKDHANEIASLDKYRYYLMDTLYDITNNISMVSVLPPFSTYGMVTGKQHYITFDKKFYDFKGECSYLLASDFLNNKFSVFVSYEIENEETVRKSLTIIFKNHRIEINTNNGVTIDGQGVELPIEVDSQTWIKRTGERVLVHSDLGIEVECNLHHDICIVELSGWYFGKTGGLLGTFDYEPSNDLSLPNGTVANTMESFANSWHVGSTRCQSMNHATVPVQVEKESTAISETNQCTAYFEEQLSSLRSCFSRVEPIPFYEMCLSELRDNKKEGVCLSVAAYVSQCRRAGVDIWMPHECVRCLTANGSAMNANQLKVFDGVDAMLADVVFVVEQSPCIKKINLAELVSKLDTSLNHEGLDTRFSVVGFNGNKLSEPHTRTTAGKIWGTVTGAEKALRSLQTAISKRSGSESQSAFSALRYASRLSFRETASKTIVLVQCTSCQETDEEYSEMISMLLENDITMHMLQPHALKLRSGQGKVSKVYGVDLNGAFSGRNLKSLMPSFPLLRQVALPKDLCSPLAFETNGTLFNMDRLLQNDKNTHRVNVKKFIDVWARRVTLTAKPSQCQKCECVPNQDGVGQIVCTKCLSPSIEHFLKQWENMQVENQRTSKGLVDDYMDYPA